MMDSSNSMAFERITLVWAKRYFHVCVFMKEEEEDDLNDKEGDDDDEEEGEQNGE